MSVKRYCDDVNSESSFNGSAGFLYNAKKLFLNACVIYTVIVIFLAVVISAMNSGKDEGVVFFIDLICLYPLSVLISGANMIFANKKLNIWIRLILHVSIIFAGFAVYMGAIKQYEINSLVMLTPVFAVVYALIMCVVLILRSMKKKQERDNIEYSDVYAKVRGGQNNRSK